MTTDPTPLRDRPGDRPALQLGALAELVSQDTTSPARATSFRKPRVATGGGGWRIYFAGWMGLMLGPIPIGHLALGLAGLWFKFR